MRLNEEVDIKVVEEWLTGEYYFTIATYTWHLTPPRPPTIKYYLIITNCITNCVTLIHSSVCYRGVYFDINVDSSR